MREASTVEKAGEGLLRRHAVALISLAVALFSSSYNTWRNQTTEAHRNVRSAAFGVIEQLGEMQQLVDARYYGGDTSEANRIHGWGKAVLVRDMSVLMSPDVEQGARALFDSWQVNVDLLEKHDAHAEEAISHAIANLRSQVLHELRNLN
jgi:hypothetical protein